MTYENTAIIELHGVEIRIDYSYSFEHGRMHMSNGDPGYPDEEDMEITSYTVNGKDFEPILERWNNPTMWDKILDWWDIKPLKRTVDDKDIFDQIYEMIEPEAPEEEYDEPEYEEPEYEGEDW